MTASATTELAHAPATLGLVARLRCAGPKHIHHLAYGSSVPDRTADHRTSRLVSLGLLQRRRVTGLNAVAYFLTEKGRRSTPLTSSMSEQVRRVPAPDVAFFALQRAALWTALVADGWKVGCGAREQLAVRRSLVDRQKVRVEAMPEGAVKVTASKVLAAIRTHPLLSPAHELRCEQCGAVDKRRSNRAVCDCGRPLKASIVENAATCRCGQVVNVDDDVQVQHHAQLCGPGLLRLLSPLPFDVATRGNEVMLLLVENPRRSVTTQVDELPLSILGQPRLSVVLRPSDDDSLYDAAASRWLQKGKRFRLLERLFSDDHVEGHFPYSTTATVVDYRPETSLRVLHKQGTTT